MKVENSGNPGISEIIHGLEAAIKPFGFDIEMVYNKIDRLQYFEDKSGAPVDNSDLTVTIVRKAKTKVFV